MTLLCRDAVAMVPAAHQDTQSGLSMPATPTPPVTRLNVCSGGGQLDLNEESVEYMFILCDCPSGQRWVLPPH